MEPQKQLTQNIVKYQDSKKAGKIKVLAHTDVYGNITAAIEQTVHDLVTGTEIIHVLAPVVVKDFDATLENIKKQLVDGDPNDPNNLGTKRLIEEAERYEKAALEARAKAEERTRDFATQIANAEAMRSDVEEAIKRKQKELQEQADAATEAAKKVIEKSGAKGAN